MSLNLPPWPGYVFPPPLPHPPPPPWSPPPSSAPTPNSSKLTGNGGAIAGVGLFISCICSLVRGHRQSRANAATDAAMPSAALTLRPQATVSDQSRRHSKQQQRRAAPAPAPEGEPRRASPASDLPSFAYSRSVRHNVTSGGSEEGAATCSVCLAAFQVGETVRLLPVCLHLYHVECIDPWLDVH